MAFEDDVWEAIRPPFRPTYKADSNLAYAAQLGKGSSRGAGQGGSYLSAASARAFGADRQARA